MSVLLCALLSSGPAQGQDASGRACSYDTCALSVRYLGGTRALVSGANHDRVARLGLFGDDVAPLFTMQDSAAAYALEHDRLAGRGILAQLAGGLLFGVGLALLSSDVDGYAPIGAMGAGAGLTIMGGKWSRKAENALMSAVWWHNRGLPAR